MSAKVGLVQIWKAKKQLVIAYAVEGETTQLWRVSQNPPPMFRCNKEHPIIKAIQSKVAFGFCHNPIKLLQILISRWLNCPFNEGRTVSFWGIDVYGGRASRHLGDNVICNCLLFVQQTPVIWFCKFGTIYFNLLYQWFEGFWPYTLTWLYIFWNVNFFCL